MADPGLNIRIGADSSTAIAGIQGVRSALKGMLQQAAGVAAGMGIVRAVDTAVGALTSIPRAMIGVNAEMEAQSVAFETLLSDSAVKGAQKAALSEQELADATRSTASAVRDAQEHMADAAEDHARAVAKIGGEMAKAQAQASASLGHLAADYAKSMAEIEARHAETMSELTKQQATNQASFERSVSERARVFDRAMSDLVSSHGRTMASLQQQQQSLADDFMRQTQERQSRFKEETRLAPDRFLREREAAKRSAEEIQSAIDSEAAKGMTADKDLLAALQRRLAEEKTAQSMSFADFVALQKQRQTEEEAAAHSAHQKALAALLQRMAEEQAAFEQRKQRLAADYAADVAKLKEALGEQQAAVVERIAKEQAAVARAVEERKAKYAEDVANAKAAMNERIVTLQESLDTENRQYQKQVRDIRQALDSATENHAKAVMEIQRQAQGTVNQIPQMVQNLAQATGMGVETAKDRAAAMMSWIRQKAKTTPFDVPGLVKMTNQLTAFRLDATQFLDTVGNIAAGMNVPLDQVSGAFGALASGQMGEAVMRFREFGVNLRDVQGLKFDAQGSLVTPIDEALAKVKTAMDERFGGLMEAQSHTFAGVMSNLRDAWGQFLEVAGRPMFEKARAGLSVLQAWLDNNQGKIEAFAKSLGEGLGQAIDRLKPQVSELMTGLFEWVRSGQAEADVKQWVAGLVGISKAISDAIRFASQLSQRFKENELALKALTAAVIVLVTAALGPVALALLGIGAAFFLIRDYVIPAVAAAFESFQATVLGVWEAVKAAVGTVFTWVSDRAGEFQATVLGVWEVVKTTALGTFVQIGRGLASAANAYINVYESMINAIIDALNAFITSLVEKFNAISSVVGGPRIEFGGFGRVELPRLDLATLPGLPELAHGAITTGPTLALIGDNPTGREAIIPLDRYSGGGDTYHIAISGPVYGVSNLEDVLVAAIEKAQRRGRLSVAGT